MTQPDLFGTAPATVNLTPLQSERKRREGNYQNVLSRLKWGPADNHVLALIAGYRFGARIHELRQDGAEIKREHVGKGTYVYTMTKEPSL